jgi:ribulose-5-phosphate 4-epimerase/fuculose-1-phosphate aldolase
MDHYNAIKQLVEALHLMGKRNDVIRDTHGNLSAIVPGGVVYIKPSGVPYEEIHGTDIPYAAVLDGHMLHEPLKPSVDLPHHLEIYRQAPQVHAICHTHSPYATVFAMGIRAIPCLCTEQADYFGGPIRCIEYHDLNTWGTHAAPREGEKALLLGNHGALTFGNTPKEAVNLAIALENVAQKTYLALMLHDRSATKYRLLEAEVEKWHERYNNVYGQR